MADERIDKGMERQLATRERESAERPPVGWKLGFGTAPAMEKLSISAPLVGYLTSATRAEGGEGVSLEGLANPKLEPEIAITLATDVPPQADDTEIRDAIGGVGPAFELVDLDAEQTDVEAILAGDIFHRAWALGASGSPSLLDDPAPRLTTGDEDAEALDAYGVTGDPVGLLRSLASTLAATGQVLAAGDVVICGSIRPPLDPVAGSSYTLAIEGAGVAEIRFAG